MDQWVNPGRQALLAALSAQNAIQSGESVLKHIETHAADVLLTQTVALKLKKPVRFPFLDFSTEDRREAALRAELAVNAIWSGALYQGVLPVLKEGTGYRLGTAGESDRAVDWALKMHRFDAETEFSNWQHVGTEQEAHIRAIARRVAQVQCELPVLNPANGTARIQRLITNCSHELTACGVLERSEIERFSAAARTELSLKAQSLDQRARAGRIRRGHGDLHLGNLALWHEQPLIFDALEFDPALAEGDVLYDIAFLIMDLAHSHGARPANIALNAWVSEAAGGRDMDVYAGLTLLPLFAALRAAIRALVWQERAIQETDTNRHFADEETGGAYLDEAIEWLAAPPPVLVAIGGLSGTGKTTLAQAISPYLGGPAGAVHLRSDVIRKQLAGVPETARLGPEHYTSEATAKVYAALHAAARACLQGGTSVIVDAVNARPEERAALEAIQNETDATFRGIWLDLETDVRAARVNARRADASDADAEIARAQTHYDLGRIDWMRVGVSGDPDAMRDRIARRLGLAQPPA